jgi:hypothetical protein
VRELANCPPYPIGTIDAGVFVGEHPPFALSRQALGFLDSPAMSSQIVERNASRYRSRPHEQVSTAKAIARHLEAAKSSQHNLACEIIRGLCDKPAMLAQEPHGKLSQRGESFA